MEMKVNITLKKIIDKYFIEEIKEKIENEKMLNIEMPKLSQLQPHPLQLRENENNQFMCFLFSCNRWDC